jgi:predicted O-linked N-acetylglucosamine transferase (SPINDLY family)
MHTAGNRLLVFARKPAPVQVSYLGSGGGTALDTIDYRLTDQYLDSDQADDPNFMEKSIRLAGTYWCFQQSIATGPVSSLPALTAGRVMLGCLNNVFKVSRDALETWAELLNILSDARLLLYSSHGSRQDWVTRFLEERGVASERLEFVNRASPADYFNTYHRIDMALDSFPCAGATTTCDALWMGVPVVTLAGRRAVGRAGVSILSNAGLPELIARSPQEYIRIASSLASDLPRLAELRATLRERMRKSALMDRVGYARGIEAAYRTMWRNWCAQTTGNRARGD